MHTEPEYYVFYRGDCVPSAHSSYASMTRFVTVISNVLILSHSSPGSNRFYPPTGYCHAGMYVRGVEYMTVHVLAGARSCLFLEITTSMCSQFSDFDIRRTIEFVLLPAC